MLRLLEILPDRVGVLHYLDMHHATHIIQTFTATPGLHFAAELICIYVVNYVLLYIDNHF